MFEWLVPKSLRNAYRQLNANLVVANHKLTRIERDMVTQTEAMQVLEQEVAQMSDVVLSAVTTLTRLSDMIRAYVGEPDKLKALADQLDGSAAALAAAIAATPPPPAPPVEPPVTGPTI